MHNFIKDEQREFAAALNSHPYAKDTQALGMLAGSCTALDPSTKEYAQRQYGKPQKVWAEMEKAKELHEQINIAENSFQKIAAIVQSAYRYKAGPNPLLQSDFENAIKHSVQLTKQLRLIKKLLFAAEAQPKLSE